MVFNVGKKASSSEISLFETELGTSPCRFSTRLCFSIAAKVGRKSSNVATPDSEFVVTPKEYQFCRSGRRIPVIEVLP
jgi:hypothetical protein